MSRLTPRLAAAAAAVVMLTALAGCGSSSSSGNGVASKSPTAVVGAAKAAAAGAATVHVAGSMLNEGKPISLDMELEAAKGGKGTITLEGLPIELVALNRIVYIKGSDAFYRRVAGAAAAQVLRGKWLKAPASSGNFSSLASLADLNKLVGATLASHGALTPAGTTTVNGQKAVGVSDKAKGGTLYVAASGPAYPLEIVKSGGSGGKIVFDRWNKPVTITPPLNAVNIDQLQSGH